MIEPSFYILFNGDGYFDGKESDDGTFYEMEVGWFNAL